MNEEQPRDHDIRDNADPDKVGDEPGDDTYQETHEEPRGSGDLQANIKSRSTWLRLLFMLVFVFLYGVSRVVVGAVVVLQFFWVLFTGEVNDRLQRLGQSLATYTWQMIRYLTYNTNSRPFPFDEDWPSSNTTVV